MTPEEAPVGTVVRIGHPANNAFAQKTLAGTWRMLVPHGRLVDPEDVGRSGVRISDST
jgi:hypothetical protein